MIHLMKIIGRRTGTMPKPNMDMVKKYVSETYTEAKNTGYMLTSTRDNDDDCAIYFYDNAVEAVNAFNRYVDWGFAKDFLTIRLYEPTGNINQKVLKRATGGHVCPRGLF
jgi:predicted phosphatase